MRTSTTLLLVIASALLFAALLMTYRASGARNHDFSMWPTTAAFSLAVALFGVAAFTA